MSEEHPPPGFVLTSHSLRKGAPATVAYAIGVVLQKVKHFGGWADLSSVVLDYINPSALPRAASWQLFGWLAPWAGARALQRQHAPAAAAAAHDATLAATARWCANHDVYRKLCRTPLRVPADGRTRRRSARARAAFAEAAEVGADAAADKVPPAVVDVHHRAAKLTAVQKPRRDGQALDTADLGVVSDAAMALPALEALHPPPAATGPEYSPPEEPPDLQRAAPSWGDDADEVRRWGEDQRRILRRAPRLAAEQVDWWRWEHIRDLDVPLWRLWVNRCLAGRGHSRTAAFLASGTVFALHKDDPAEREERATSGEPPRVRPLGVGSVLLRMASAHAMGQVGTDAREVIGPVQLSF
eukprot:jgi/Tetstr1/422113/TSEL_012970.t1